MKIKMYHVSNLEKFMELVSQCKGNVYVVSEDGDKLNLKSKLTQFVALSKQFASGYIESLSLETTDESDSALLLNYMISGEQ